MIPFYPTTFSIQQLTFERHYQILFKKLNIELRSGELLQICGNNGAGKSTLLRILAGFIEPPEGNILWQGQSIFIERDQYQKQIHYLGHQNGVRAHLTVYENLLFYCTLANKPADANYIQQQILEVGLGRYTHKKAAHLSAGQLRRLALLRLLLNPAPLWLLDEPMTALDAAGKTLLFRYLRAHLANQGMVMVATHEPLPFSGIHTLQLGRTND